MPRRTGKHDYLSDEHRDEIAQAMVAAFVRIMKSDIRLGHPWMGLSIAQQTELGDKMVAIVMPTLDDLEDEARKAIKLDEDKAEAETAEMHKDKAD